ncbi:hypothetical protein QUA56_11450, partial [Microcoleus sp. N3A4]|uniref:hypothetical protein n=1 Tax=Microcoleus sp. N3A4 TaxID=3055379 RepID=UPI002FD32EC6
MRSRLHADGIALSVSIETRWRFCTDFNCLRDLGGDRAFISNPVASELILPTAFETAVPSPYPVIVGRRHCRLLYSNPRISRKIERDQNPCSASQKARV